MILEFTAEEQPLDGIVVCEQGHHVLEKEAFAERQKVDGAVDLGVDIVTDDIVQVDQ